MGLFRPLGPSEAGIWDLGIIFELLNTVLPKLAEAVVVRSLPCSTPCAESQAYVRSPSSLSTGWLSVESGETTNVERELCGPRLTSCNVGASVSNSFVKIDPEPSCPCRPIRPTKCRSLVGEATMTLLVSDLPGMRSTHNPATGPSDILKTPLRYFS